MYQIKIKIDHPNIRMILLKENKKLDESEWEDENNLSVTLLKKIDELLQKNNIKKNQLEEVAIESGQSSYSSSRISAAVSRISNYYLTNYRK